MNESKVRKGLKLRGEQKKKAESEAGKEKI
jgi:hypothetical protein